MHKRNTCNFAQIWCAICDKFAQRPPRERPLLGTSDCYNVGPLSRPRKRQTGTDKPKSGKPPRLTLTLRVDSKAHHRTQKSNGVAIEVAFYRMGNRPDAKIPEKWEIKWKMAPGPKRPKNGQKSHAFWGPFFHFGGHFSAISGLGPFSIFFPIFPGFLRRAAFPFCIWPLRSQKWDQTLFFCFNSSEQLLHKHLCSPSPRRLKALRNHARVSPWSAAQWMQELPRKTEFRKTGFCPPFSGSCRGATRGAQWFRVN